MKNHSWHKVQPGQIVSFTYKNKSDVKGIKRTVMCLNPRLRFKKKSGQTTYFFVALQLDTAITRPITTTKFEKLIAEVGGITVDENVREIGRFEDRTNRLETKLTYRGLKKLLTKYNIFRTYNLRECRKRRVYLEDDYKGLPKDSVDQLLSEQKTLQMDIFEDEY